MLFNETINVIRQKFNPSFNLLINSWVNIEQSLEIIGSGPEEGSLRRLITSLELDNRISIVTDCNYPSIEEKYKTAKGLIVCGK